MPQGKKRTTTSRRVSLRTKVNVSRPLSTTRTAGAVGCKRPRHGQEGLYHNEVTSAGIGEPEEATPNDNSVPLTRGDIPSLVREIVVSLSAGNGSSTLQSEPLDGQTSSPPGTNRAGNSDTSSSESTHRPGQTTGPGRHVSTCYATSWYYL